ncbi:ClC family H(+)/Cl(-) exchange transporter [Liquorilactobacillus cacaonum]|uniref:RCK C-terminal domain-containing protein n=1 Tax=Liquorilactobacillus cacaonum DSM 21116 TaxID=1423729 RepID=A0A0R2CPV5_9LACO|nr:ClC family H(+)/Cl(-) exchange transporter [Liquorilactobacillus cacaonum]KRM90441.1 hypothetical protein FC80_GL001345 [Liquorilactobacillus cacaonum DSM 21116]
MIRLQAIIRGAIVGIIVGIVVSSFRFSIEKMLFFFKKIYNFAGEGFFNFLLITFLLVLLSVIIGFFIKKQPHIMGSGIPEVELQLTNQLSISPYSVLYGKFIAGILAIGTGGFLGREGPSVQLGAAVGQIFAEKLSLNKNDWRLLVASGAAAGLSSAFGAPLAGTLFILEEVSHSFSTLLWLQSLSAALMSDLITSYFFGLKPVLSIHYTATFPLRYYWILLLLGVILGLLGRFYQVATLKTYLLYRYLQKIPRKWQTIIMFVGILPIGIYLPNLLGGGSILIDSLAVHAPSLAIIFGIFVIRFGFSWLSFGSGAPGGIFLPILTLGAIIGVFIGKLGVDLHLLPPVYLPNIIIFSLAGYFACISKAPFTAIILVTEMVGSLSHLMPLALVALIAYIVVDFLGGEPIYESLSSRMITFKKLSQHPKKLTRVDFKVPVLSSIVGQEIRAIPWPKNVILTRIQRNGDELLGRGDLIIESNDLLIFWTVDENTEVIRKQLKSIVL